MRAKPSHIHFIFRLPTEAQVVCTSEHKPPLDRRVRLGQKVHQAPLGPLGQLGGSGFKGICPKYCAIDGGVFFEDGTRR
uniref:Secreted protein n=1 Tax=Globodera pallida TaxID=36090 RepID=A0A183CPB8_GLOPA